MRKIKTIRSLRFEFAIIDNRTIHMSGKCLPVRWQLSDIPSMRVKCKFANIVLVDCSFVWCEISFILGGVCLVKWRNHNSCPVQSEYSFWYCLLCVCDCCENAVKNSSGKFVYWKMVKCNRCEWSGRRNERKKEKRKMTTMSHQCKTSFKHCSTRSSDSHSQQ